MKTILARVLGVILAPVWLIILTLSWITMKLTHLLRMKGLYRSVALIYIMVSVYIVIAMVEGDLSISPMWKVAFKEAIETLDYYIENSFNS